MAFPLREPARTSETWRRASPTELWILAAYFLSAIVLTDVFNFRLGVEFMTLLVVVAGIAITRAPVTFFKDWWFFLVGLVMWNLSGPIAAQSPFADPVTKSHLDFMLYTDRVLFLGHDPALLQHALANGLSIGPLDWITSMLYNLHVPEPYIAGYFLWRLNRIVYLQFAASALILLVLGLVTFIVFPAIPPWMASTWFHRLPDVYNRFGLTLQAHPLPFHGTPIFYVFGLHGDAVAAFPSEHAAFPLLEFLAFSRAAGKIVAGAFLAYTLVVLFCIVYLGEHWVTDALAGYVYALAIFWFVRRVSRPPRVTRRTG